MSYNNNLSERSENMTRNRANFSPLGGVGGFNHTAVA